MKPWGLITDGTESKVFDMYSDGKSVRIIAEKLGLPEKSILEIIKKPQFKADLKLLDDDLAIENTPRGRVKRLQDLALDVMAQEMENPRSRKRFEAAQDILDRGGDVPRRQQTESLGMLVSPGELAMIAVVLRELGQSPAVRGILPESQLDVIDVTPEPIDVQRAQQVQ